MSGIPSRKIRIAVKAQLSCSSWQEHDILHPGSLESGLMIKEAHGDKNVCSGSDTAHHPRNPLNAWLIVDHMGEVH